MVNLDKKLYMLHIPKTAGLAVQKVSDVLAQQGIRCYPNDPSGNDYAEYSYIQGHFGTQPLDMYPEISVATVVRNPVDRMISNFLWLSRRKLFNGQQGYEDSRPLIEQLRYYLFEDSNFIENNNLMTRFLSNPSKKDMFHASGYGTYLSPKDTYKTFHIDGSNTSVENAKKTIDRVDILGITEDLDSFMEKVFIWVESNFEVDVRDGYYELIKNTERITGTNKVNFSSLVDADGSMVTTNDLKQMLNQSEIDRILDNNSMDLEIYNYVKSKL